MVFQLAPLLPALIGGAASMFGGAMANSANKEAAQTQMDFQERQSNTQYQRGMADMKAAGLNPMLAYSQGGASSASGASYQAQNVGEAAVRGAESGVNSAKAGSMMKSQIENIEADTRLKASSDKAAIASSIASMANAGLASANSATVNALRPFTVERALYDAENASMLAGISTNTYQKGNVEREYLQSPVGKLLRTLGYGGTDAAAGISSAKGMLPKFLR